MIHGGSGRGFVRGSEEPKVTAAAAIAAAAAAAAAI